MSLPCLLDAWYPAARGPLLNAVVIGDAEPATPADVKRAWAELRSGATLIVVDGLAAQGKLTWRQWGWVGRRRRTTAAAQALGRSASVDRWFVAPGTGGSHVLLPCEDARAFRAALQLLPAGRRRWRVLRSALSFASRLGLASRCGLGELTVAVKGPQGSPLVPWSARNGRRAMGVSLGVPGPHRKAVLCFTGDDARAPAILKLSVTTAAKRFISRELQAIERAGKIGDFAPRLLAGGQHGGRAWMVTDVLEGARSPDALRRPHIAFLREIGSATRTETTLDKLPAFRIACDRLEAIETKTSSKWWRGFERLRVTLEAQLGSSPVPCTLAHGDFAPWNLVVSQERLRAFDWEYSDPLLPALYDLLHFHVQTAILVRHRSASTVLAELDGLVEGRAAELCTAVGAHDTNALVGLYLFLIATRDEYLNADGEPPFAQVVWQRDARLALALEVTARLHAEAPAPRDSEPPGEAA